MICCKGKREEKKRKKEESENWGDKGVNYNTVPHQQKSVYCTLPRPVHRSFAYLENIFLHSHELMLVMPTTFICFQLSYVQYNGELQEQTAPGTCLFILLSLYWSVFTFIFRCVCMKVSLFMYHSVYQDVCLSLCFSVQYASFFFFCLNSLWTGTVEP